MLAATGTAVLMLLGGAVACGGIGSGALPSVTATPTRSLPPRTSAPTTATSSQAVVAPSAVASSTPTAAATPTTAPVTASSDSGSTWGWWVLAIVLLATVVGGIIWAVLRRRRKWAEWRAAMAPVARQTHVVTDLLPVPPQRTSDPVHWQQVREQAEHNAKDLETVAVGAPSDDATRVTQGVATALREEVSALEALRLLDAAPTAPTGPQLSQAEDVTRRARGDLDTSQARLDALIGRPTGADAAPPASIN